MKQPTSSPRLQEARGIVEGLLRRGARTANGTDFNFAVKYFYDTFLPQGVGDYSYPVELRPGERVLTVHGERQEVVQVKKN